MSLIANELVPQSIVVVDYGGLVKADPPVVEVSEKRRASIMLPLDLLPTSLGDEA